MEAQTARVPRKTVVLIVARYPLVLAGLTLLYFSGWLPAAAGGCGFVDSRWRGFGGIFIFDWRQSGSQADGVSSRKGFLQRWNTRLWFTALLNRLLAGIVSPATHERWALCPRIRRILFPITLPCRFWFLCCLRGAH